MPDIESLPEPPVPAVPSADPVPVMPGGPAISLPDTIAVLLAFFSLHGIGGYLVRLFPDIPGLNFVSAGAAANALLALAILVLFRIEYENGWERIGLVSIRLVRAGGYALGILLLAFAAGFIYMQVIRLCIPASEDMESFFRQETLERVVGLGREGHWGMMVFTAVVAAPLAEEFIFRGVLYSAIRERWGFVAALATTSVLFGVIHGELVVIPPLACFGMFLALGREWTGSIIPGIFAHALHNALALVSRNAG
ncbi:MAG: CPBP family intramembrane glutamic endopeptidase [Planctomycetota bacterium]